MSESHFQLLFLLLHSLNLVVGVHVKMSASHITNLRHTILSIDNLITYLEFYVFLAIIVLLQRGFNPPVPKNTAMFHILANSLNPLIKGIVNTK